SAQDKESLEKLLRSILDKSTGEELAELADNLETICPGDEVEHQHSFPQGNPAQSNEATELMEMLQKIDELEMQLNECQYNLSLAEVDEKLLEELLGDEAAQDVEKLRSIAKILEEAGYICLKGNKYELTPRGMRKIGQKALEDIFAQFRKDRGGRHNMEMKGSGGERIDETKKYEFGDEFHIHLQKTIMNSLYREAGKLPIKLSTEDFEIHKTEGIAMSATVLMVDLSVSMPMRGNFEAAKRVAIALDGLIRTQYPKDTLYIVGFSSYARQIKKEDLTCMSWDEFDPYTNLQHGLFVARKLLTKERCNNKQIILVTDGEPTAHFEGGEILLHNNPRTLQLTLREVRNCTQKGIVINTFMLESSRFLSAFATQIARLNKGRLFFTNADTLGQYLLVDYISNKKKKL
ncbi:MAG: VWA domain-containing protein, partial [Chloroflexi bacterium]|nr:VWA domain-containing protein [Chloroflexota bacterium]